MAGLTPQQEKMSFIGYAYVLKGKWYESNKDSTAISSTIYKSYEMAKQQGQKKLGYLKVIELWTP